MMTPIRPPFQRIMAQSLRSRHDAFDLARGSVNHGSTAHPAHELTPLQAGRFPSPCGRIGFPLSRPLALLFSRFRAQKPIHAHARTYADCVSPQINPLPLLLLLAESQSIRTTYRGKQLWDFLNGLASALWQAPLPGAAIRALNKACLAQVLALRQPLFSTQTLLPPPPQALSPTSPSAKPTPRVAKRLSGGAGPHQYHLTCKTTPARRGGLFVVMSKGPLLGPRTGRDWECSKRS